MSAVFHNWWLLKIPGEINKKNSMNKGTRQTAWRRHAKVQRQCRWSGRHRAIWDLICSPKANSAETAKEGSRASTPMLSVSCFGSIIVLTRKPGSRSPFFPELFFKQLSIHVQLSTSDLTTEVWAHIRTGGKRGWAAVQFLQGYLVFPQNHLKHKWGQKGHWDSAAGRRIHEVKCQFLKYRSCEYLEGLGAVWLVFNTSFPISQSRLGAVDIHKHLNTCCILQKETHGVLLTLQHGRPTSE